MAKNVNGIEETAATVIDEMELERVLRQRPRHLYEIAIVPVISLVDERQRENDNGNRQNHNIPERDPVRQLCEYLLQLMLAMQVCGIKRLSGPVPDESYLLGDRN